MGNPGYYYEGETTTAGGPILRIEQDENKRPDTPYPNIRYRTPSPSGFSHISLSEDDDSAYQAHLDFLVNIREARERQQELQRPNQWAQANLMF